MSCNIWLSLGGEAGLDHDDTPDGDELNDDVVLPQHEGEAAACAAEGGEGVRGTNSPAPTEDAYIEALEEGLAQDDAVRPLEDDESAGGVDSPPDGEILVAPGGVPSS